MKIYSIALFLLITNMCLGLLVQSDILPASISTDNNYNSDYFTNELDKKGSYSNADMNLYSAGDFIASLKLLSKLFVMGPALLASLLSSAGLDTNLSSIFISLTYAVYVVGVAQVLMRFSIDGNY